MHLIAYTSEMNPKITNEDAMIQDIVKVSKDNNAESDITGVLFFEDRQFLQVIEGEEKNLRALMDSIANDDRHHNVKILLDSEEQERGFGTWKMDEIQLGKGKNFEADYLESITKSFEKLMVPGCDNLVHFYKALLAERKRILGLF